MSAEAVVSVEGLSVDYGKAPILEGVSLEVPPGSVVALLGRNGAGKSSLVRCALGLQKPQRGRVRLFGEDSWSRRTRVMGRVGVVPEEPDAPALLTPWELVRFCAPLYPAWSDSHALERLRRFGVPLATPFGRLSKGQKGAVMLSLALAASPELLILDDPTLGLDAAVRSALYDELIQELADRQTSVLVTSHDLSGIETLADRVAILLGTGIALDEPLDAIKQRFRRLRCTGGASWEPFEVACSTELEWGREAVVTNFDEDRLSAFAARSGAADLEVGTLGLEEIFRAVAIPGGEL